MTMTPEPVPSPLGGIESAASVAPLDGNENPWSVETMTTTRFTKQFDGCTSLDGREYIEAEIRPGLTIRAYAQFDEMTTPGDWEDSDTFTPEEISAWRCDEWSFAVVRCSAYLSGRCIAPHLGSISGIQHDEAGDGRSLNEAAEELLEESEADAIRACKEFAETAAKAIR